MPVIGVICCRTNEPARFNDCIQCAKTGSPGRCIYPLHLLQSMAGNEAGRVGAGISVTTLLGCHRRAQLHQGYDYYEDPELMEARFKGTLVHEGMERLIQGHKDVIQEVRYGRRIDGQAITGKMDMILPNFVGGARIVDFKSAGRRKLGPDMVPSESHVEQVNIYRWIVEDGYEVEYTDHPDIYEDVVQIQRRVQFKVGSAAILYIGDTGMQEVEIPLWPLEKTADFVREKYEAYKEQALSPILPDRLVKKRGTANQPVIVFSDDEVVPEPEPERVESVPHWMCTNCALFDICRSLPKEGIDWEYESENDDEYTS